MKPYLRKVQYYETDMMGIVHHANYIHWMEEARIDFMEQLGYPYGDMEQSGIYSPVRSLACDYRKPCTFNDEISVTVSISAFTGARLILRYEIRKGDELICEARSEHAFVDKAGRIIRLPRAVPALAQKIALLSEHSEKPAEQAEAESRGS